MSLNDLERKETTEANAATIQGVTKDRRAFRRRPFRAKLYFQTDELGLTPLVEASPVNVSEDGVCFKTQATLAPRALVSIEIHHPALRKQLKMQAEIIWIKAMDECYSYVGCRWRRRLSSGELHQFV